MKGLDRISILVGAGWVTATNLCLGAGPIAAQGSVRDSVGVVIVTNPEGAEERAPHWTVSGPPTLSIGTMDGEGPYQISVIMAVARFANGNVLVVDGQTREVRTFGPDGAHIRTMGGQGEGPGEFMIPSFPALRMRGDTVALWDLGLRRFTFVTSDGAYAGNLTPHASVIVPVGFLGGRSLVLQGPADAGTGGLEEGLHASAIHYKRVELDGPEATDSIVTLGHHLHVMSNFNGQLANTFVPYSGPALAGVEIGRFVAADGRPRELRVYGDEGRLTRIIRVAGGPEPLTGAEFRAEVAYRMESVSPASEPAFRRRYAEMPIPESKPAYAGTLLGGGMRILLEQTGPIWIERFTPRWDERRRWTDPEPSRWTVFSAEGEILATAEMPPGFTPYEVTPAGVLGVYRGEFDLEAVWLLPVRRGG
jgi:hypothetical protein